MASPSVAVTFDSFTMEKHTVSFLDQWVTLAGFFQLTRLLVIDEDNSGAVRRWMERLAIPQHAGFPVTAVEVFSDEHVALDHYLDRAWIYVEQPRKLADVSALDVSPLFTYHHERIRDVVYAFGPNGKGFAVRHADSRAFVTIEPPGSFPGLWNIQAASMVLYDRLAKAVTL